MKMYPAGQPIEAFQYSMELHDEYCSSQAHMVDMTKIPTDLRFYTELSVCIVFRLGVGLKPLWL